MRRAVNTILLTAAVMMFALMLSDFVFASGQRDDSEEMDGNVSAEAHADADAYADAEASAGSFSSVGNISSSTTVTIEGDQRPSEIKIKNTPTAIASDIFPTVPCFKGAAAAGSVPGFGISIGGGRVDKDCVKREYIRLAYAMGLLDRATFLWCKQPAVWQDFGTIQDCLLFEVERDSEDEGETNDETELAQISEEQFDEREEKVDAEIEELRERAEAAERRARQLESKVGGYRKGEESKQSQLEKLRVLLEQDYERLEQQTEK